MEKKKSEVMQLFAQCTKEDVSLNNFLSRARSFFCVYEPVPVYL